MTAEDTLTTEDLLSLSGFAQAACDAEELFAAGDPNTANQVLSNWLDDYMEGYAARVDLHPGTWPAPLSPKQLLKACWLREAEQCALRLAVLMAKLKQKGAGDMLAMAVDFRRRLNRVGSGERGRLAPLKASRPGR